MQPLSVVVLRFADGRVGRMQLFIDGSDEDIEAVISKMAVQPVAWRRSTMAEFPTDGTFRDAWADDGVQVKIDIGRAKEVAHQRRRRSRAVEFSPLDQSAIVALADRGALAAIEVQRQAIRDKYAVMQAEIDKAETPDELKALLNG